MRDLLLGVTVVLGDGLVASSGGKVVKNVAGYDLGKLLCGSRGTLGVVCRASLRLHPLPDASATLVAPVFRDDGEAKRQAILRSTLVPSALDVTDERLAVMFEGGAAAVEFQLGAARELVGGKRAGDEVWDEVRARPRPQVDERRPGPPRAPRAHPGRARPGMIERELIDACTHCGFCLPTCPTYGPLGQMEADSPRGRIWLMKGLADGTMTANSSVVEHIDRCLGCMACVTACPSGVRYDLLIEQTREVVEEQYDRPAGDWLLRTLVFSVFPYPRRLRAALALAPPRRHAAAEVACARWPTSLRRGARTSGRPERTVRCGSSEGASAC